MESGSQQPGVATGQLGFIQGISCREAVRDAEAAFGEFSQNSIQTRSLFFRTPTVGANLIAWEAVWGLEVTKIPVVPRPGSGVVADRAGQLGFEAGCAPGRS